MSIALLGLACLGTGLAIRLLRRWPHLVFAASFLGAAALFAILALAPAAPFDLFGRTLSMDESVRGFLWMAVGTAAALAFLGPVSFVESDDMPATIIANSQGAFFYWSLAPLILAIAVDSFPLSVFFWAIGLIILMLMATPQREGRVGGAAQFLLLTVVASASLLLANRFLDLFPLTPENSDLATNAVIFLSLGFGLLLAVVPLSIWLGPLADELPILGTGFLVAVAQPVGLWLLIRLMSQTLWLTNASPLLAVLVYAGCLTAPVGAVLALAERRDGRFLAFISLVSLGQALVGLGLGTRGAFAGAILSTLDRAIGVALLAGGLAFVRHHGERRWQLIGAASILAGGIALAGIPPGLGFAAGWAIYRDLASTHLKVLAILILSNAAVLLETLRVAWPIFSGTAPQGETPGTKSRVVPYLCASVILILLVSALVLGLFPQLASSPLLAALGDLNYLK